MKRTRLLISIFLIFNGPFTLKAQLNDTKSFYSNQKLKGTENCFIEILKDNSIKQIILIRHGKPKLNKKGWFSSRDAQEYSRKYDLVTVEKINKSPICFDAKKLDTLYSSNLVRAKNTANQIKKEAICLKSDPMFREFERDIFSLPILKMPLNFWLVTSRLFWYSGIHSNVTESRNKAIKRVKKSAYYLELRAEENETVILVAHGMFNGKLSKVLKKNGWEKVFDNGKGYLSVKIMAKKKKGP